MKTGKIIFGLGGAFIILATLSLVPVPEHNLFWRKLFDAGHIVLFALLAPLVLRAVRSCLRGKYSHPLFPYVLTLGLIGLLGSLMELVQIPSDRDADVLDLIRDMAGGSLGLLAVMTFDNGADRVVCLGSRSRTAIRLVCAVLFVLIQTPLARTLASYYHRNTTFPILATFDNPRERPFLTVLAAELTLDKLPSEWSGTQGNGAGLLISAAGTYPGIEISEPFPNWRGYSQLALDLYNPQDTAISLHIRIHDEFHDGEYDDRFNASFEVAPGAKGISISLADIEEGPLYRRLDLSRISGIVIFLASPPQPITLYLDNLRLE